MKRGDHGGIVGIEAPAHATHRRPPECPHGHRTATTPPSTPPSTATLAFKAATTRLRLTRLYAHTISRRSPPSGSREYATATARLSVGAHDNPCSTVNGGGSPQPARPRRRPWRYTSPQQVHPGHLPASVATLLRPGRRSKRQRPRPRSLPQSGACPPQLPRRRQRPNLAARHHPSHLPGRTSSPLPTTPPPRTPHRRHRTDLDRGTAPTRTSSSKTCSPASNRTDEPPSCSRK